ncbi:hypothetical protein N7474_006297 [Penicillium riverlandense]|uniref:uncharacterized protein n=1 Tax=Penicillium riverlandense TaxID=1903569 RepID=UPI00254715DC|nr:uncharacterized protein N7474_006297 [Penicillium riverlandense]KAJ5814520.1 hypothetical protein N7474_006297 [Penicillium riverlandense]
MTAPAQTPARVQNLSKLLEDLTSCLSSTASSLPKSGKDAPSDVSIEPPPDGISLLDAKSEILLSYIHNLVFLIIFQLRQASKDEAPADSPDSLRDDIVKKLVELRVFLDRGVRPLEGRLKYQVDKVVKAAEDAERSERGTQKSKGKKARKSAGSESDEASGSEEEGASGSDDSEDEDNEDDIDEMAHRPNIAAFSKAQVEVQPTAQPAKAVKQPSNGIYRPPKIMPTALPTTERREQREDRRSRRSNVIDEFVTAEMSSAPMAEPSIGSTIIAGGRQTKSKKDREHEAERAAYEETNFVRLPKETKKQLAKRQGGRRDTTFGGDEWKGLTEGADRIERLTRRAKGSGAALDKSRKRKGIEDGPRNDGASMGQMFDKRRKKIEGWKR